MSRHSYYTSDILHILAWKQADVFEKFCLNSHNDVSHLHCLMEIEGERPICPLHLLNCYEIWLNVVVKTTVLNLDVVRALFLALDKTKRGKMCSIIDIITQNP